MVGSHVFLIMPTGMFCILLVILVDAIRLCAGRPYYFFSVYLRR